MVDWNALLARKYDIMQQGADTQRLGMTAAANLDTVKAGLLPEESKVNNAQAVAQTGLIGAQARNVDETTKFVPSLARANIALMGSQGLNFRASANATNSDTRAAEGPRLGMDFDRFSSDPLARTRSAIMQNTGGIWRLGF